MSSRMRDLTVGAIEEFPWSHYGLNDVQPIGADWTGDLADAILAKYQADGEVEPGDDGDI